MELTGELKEEHVQHMYNKVRDLSLEHFMLSIERSDIIQKPEEIKLFEQIFKKKVEETNGDKEKALASFKKYVIRYYPKYYV